MPDSRFDERQAQALRDRQARLDRMLDTVKANQELEQELHQVAVELLRADGFDPADAGAPAALIKNRFALDAAAIFLASQFSKRQDSDSAVDYASLCSRVEHFTSACDDRVSSQLSAALFPEIADANADAGGADSTATAIASCAFVPLATFGPRRKLRGVLALGAADAQRFQPGMGVLILDRLGQLISAYLAGRNLL